MVAAKIQTLIDKVDTVEIVRNQIAGILVVEQASQRALAQTAGKDPRLWALRVFTEASNPWEQFRAAPDLQQNEEPKDITPIVNVWFDLAETNRSSSTTTNRKTVDGTFNVDCYGYGISAPSGDGQASGDTAASLEAQRAARLVRNILESGLWTNLGLVGVVGDRLVKTIQQFQTEQMQRASAHVTGVRVVVLASFNEFSPQYEGQPFEGATVTVTRAPSGAISVFDFEASA